MYGFLPLLCLAAGLADGPPATAPFEAKPPSWPRAAKWAGVYGILMLLFTLSTAKKGSSPAGGVLAAVLFAVVFLPGIYYLHRLQYRTYLRQLEKQGKSKG